MYCPVRAGISTVLVFYLRYNPWRNPTVIMRNIADLIIHFLDFINFCPWLVICLARSFPFLYSQYIYPITSLMAVLITRNIVPSKTYWSVFFRPFPSIKLHVDSLYLTVALYTCSITNLNVFKLDKMVEESSP